MTKKDNKIEKLNKLNELRAQNMTMQQLRFFSIYLSRINARDENTRRVSFPLSDFLKIMGLTMYASENSATYKNIDTATDKLLDQKVKIPDENGGFTKYHLFKKCELKRDSKGVWKITIDADDEALPLFFDFKEKYFIYELGNVLRLSSAHQIRMYEILKQRQNMVQPVTIQLQELRELLGIPDGAYSEYNNFKRRVIDAAQKELAAQTDIQFSYTPIRAGHKVAALAFTISANKANFPQMSIAEWIDIQPESSGGPPALPVAPDATPSPEAAPVISSDGPPAAAPAPVFMPEELELYADALPESMTPGEVDALQMEARKHIDTPENRFDADIKVYDYLLEKTKLMNAQPGKVKNRFAWLKKAVAEDWK